MLHLLKTMKNQDFEIAIISADIFFLLSYGCEYSGCNVWLEEIITSCKQTNE
jgi:hypothetical protein